jgi:hypothetical protein
VINYPVRKDGRMEAPAYVIPLSKLESIKKFLSNSLFKFL